MHRRLTSYDRGTTERHPWFDTEISAYSGTGGQIAFQTAPARDDTLFADMDVVAFTQSSPAITIVRFADATLPLARYARWKISAAAAWEVTFRVWMTVRPD